MAMLPKLRAVSAAAHGTDTNMRRGRRYYGDADCVIFYSYDLPGPGVTGGLLRLGHGAERIGEAWRRFTDASGDDESMPLGDKVLVAVDVVVGVTNIVVGACDFVVGACDFAQYARGALGRFRGKYLSSIEDRITTRVKRSYLCSRKRICRRGKYDVEFEDLPEDVQCLIFSKLELKEAVRSSVLSSKWANSWMISSKLRFDGSKMYGKNFSRRYHIQRFIDDVDRVLKLQHGKVIETLEVKVEFGRILAVLLDNCVSFAAASSTKNLALDLVPKNYFGHTERYIFPFELLDRETMSRLQQIQLSFVSFKLPSEFSGFPELKRLDLCLLRVTSKDLQNMLSGCSKLEWLSISRCDLEDELIVDCPLSHLLYLRIARCKMTKIELHAAKLRTFIYNGTQLPVHTIQSQELKDVEISVSNSIALGSALTALPKTLASRVQNLTLQVPLRLKSAKLLENSSKFSQLKHLKLVLFLLDQHPEDFDNILSLASFLRAAPLIEELEIHVITLLNLTLSTGDVKFNVSGRGNAETGCLRNLPKCPYKHLRNICISGFKGFQGQAELLAHAVENAPALEVLTIDTASRNGNPLSQNVEPLGADIARSCLEGRISPKTKLRIDDSISEGLHQEWVLVQS